MDLTTDLHEFTRIEENEHELNELSRNYGKKRRFYSKQFRHR